MKYWLMKTEPENYSWNDLISSNDGVTHWEGVRNYQARNFMRDEFQIGDGILFYHSVIRPPEIAGIAKVITLAYPDHFAFDRNSKYFDPRSSLDNPRWFMVDLKAVQSIVPPITLDEIKSVPALRGMNLLQKGNRLSIQPVTENEWKKILGLRNISSSVVFDV